MTCPSSILLSQTFSSGAPGELQAHLLSCPTCAAQWKSLEQARAAALELPYVTPDPGRREQLRKRLLAAAARQPLSVGPSTRARWLGLAGAAAALLAVLMGARRLTERSPASHFRAVLQSQGASRFVHERTGTDEWVRLSDGTLSVEVQPLQPGERFRVLCGDSEVEVRGTAFTTRVEHDHLLSVDVQHGRVEVRPPDGRALLLGAGGHWQPIEAPGRPGPDAPAAGATAAPAAGSPGPPPVSAAARPAAAAGRAEATRPAGALPAAAPAATSPSVRLGRPSATGPAVAEALPVGAAAGRPAGPGQPGAPKPGLAGSPPAVAAAPARPAAEPQRPHGLKPATGAGPAAALAAASPAEEPGRPGAVPASGRPALDLLPSASGGALADPKTAISPAERAFLDGWTALRQGRHQIAAACFTRAAEQSSGATSVSLLEDARFWRAVALARAGQQPLAVAALRDFLRQHPRSARGGEATVILGWQLLREGQLDQAQRCFEAAASDPHSAVRDNARSGLTAVAARR